VKCSGHFRKAHPQQTKQSNQEIDNITANVIFNLAHLGLSIEDSKAFDLETYFEIVGLEMKVISGNKGSRYASQKDIDNFLL
jgi:hypothetical protein